MKNPEINGENRIKLPDLKDTHKEEQLQKDLEEILKLQRENKENGVTERPKELMEELLRKELVAIARNKEGHIIACFYRQPLIPEERIEQEANQIYRVGGTSLAKGKDGKATDEAKIAFGRLFIEQMEKNKNVRAITKTEADNEEMGNVLTKKGWAKVDFEECQERYPKFLEAYLNNSEKYRENKDYYRDKIFYIHSGKEKKAEV